MSNLVNVRRLPMDQSLATFMNRGDEGSKYLPERKLWVINLLYAVETILHPTKGTKKEEISQDYDWIHSEEYTPGYSFEWVCDVLDLNPQYVRDQINKALKGEIKIPSFKKQLIAAAKIAGKKDIKKRVRRTREELTREGYHANEDS